jgi:Asp-tRNA(Asn)/Glu-tRNA(Gln) amidotransferase A subunit family amidase
LKQEYVVMDELFYASASTLARRIRDRELSSEAVVQAHLQRIATINPRLNAVVQLAAEQTLADMRAADDALARG